METSTYKNIFLIIILLIIAVAIGFLVQSGARNNDQGPMACTMEAKACPDGSYVGRSGPNCEFAMCPGPTQAETIGMCYHYSKLANAGLYDRALLRMEISGDKVTGEYRNLPAEKDSKVGTFSGTVGVMDPKISARTADVWWISMAEGMTVTEQLKIQFGEGSAVALFGAMKDRGDGTYVYADTTKLTPGFQMSQIDCESI